MIVIDASAVVDALVGDPASLELLELLSASELHAPSLLDFEVASALRVHAMAGKLGEHRLAEAVEDFSALRINRYPLASMLTPVLRLRGNFTVYDASYVVLAQVIEGRLVTADAKLAEARKLGIDVTVVRPARGR